MIKLLFVSMLLCGVCDAGSFSMEDYLKTKALPAKTIIKPVDYKRGIEVVTGKVEIDKAELIELIKYVRGCRYEFKRSMKTEASALRGVNTSRSKYTLSSLVNARALLKVAKRELKLTNDKVMRLRKSIDAGNKKLAFYKSKIDRGVSLG